MRLTFRFGVLLAAIAIFSLPASADTYNFACVSNNSATNCAIGGQLAVTVTAGPTAGTVQFLFQNLGPVASSITDIYFQTGGFVSPPLTITNSTGVDFSVVANPGSLPSAPAGFTTTAQLTADSNPPAAGNGINPGESLTIIANLSSGVSLADLITGMNSGSVVVGIHVQAFGDGGSESFVNRPPNVVPEPASMLLFGTGLAGLAGVIRRRRAA